MRFSIFYLISIIFSKLFTFLFFRKAKIVFWDVVFRRKNNFIYKQGLRIGRNSVIEILSNDGEIQVGINFLVYQRLHIGCYKKIIIGDNVLVGSDVLITDHSHGQYSGEIQSAPNIPPNQREIVSDVVEIGSNVWIGDKVTILKGVKIGEGSIIGANSLVNKDIPANVIAVGSPAKPIKKYSYEKRAWENL